MLLASRPGIAVITASHWYRSMLFPTRAFARFATDPPRPATEARMNRQPQSQRKTATAKMHIRTVARTRTAEPAQTVRSIIAKTRNSWHPASDEVLSLESVIGVGHGYAALTRDGEPVFEENGKEFDELITVADADRLAGADPQHDWKIHLVAFLDDRHYQREGEGRWVLVRRGYGLS
jgi:hypothetical protein